jgi:hypothetical protein
MAVVLNIVVTETRLRVLPFRRFFLNGLNTSLQSGQWNTSMACCSQSINQKHCDETGQVSLDYGCYSKQL